MRVHPFPFRTRKLSSSVATILGWRRPGKIARRQHKEAAAFCSCFSFLCPSPDKSPPEEARECRLHVASLLAIITCLHVTMNETSAFPWRSAPASPRGSQTLRLIPRTRAPRRDVCVPRSGAALMCHRHVIHFRAPASQPQGKPGYQSSLRRCGEGHPEKETSIACRNISGTEMRIPPACLSSNLCPLRFSALGTGGAGGRPCRALSPVSLAQEKPGRRRPRRNGPHRLPRRRKSHGLRIRGCRKSRECLRAFDCSSSSNRSIRFDLRYGGYG